MQRKAENDVRASLRQPRDEVLLMQNFRVKKHVITSFYLEPFITRTFKYSQQDVDNAAIWQPNQYRKGQPK